MSKRKHFVIDFDSTFTQVEALEELGEISLAGNVKKGEILIEIERLTNAAMAGEFSFTESLKRRIALLEAHRDHLPGLIDRLRGKVSISIERNRQFFADHAEEVIILSNGFTEFITPIVTEFGVKAENVYANSFVFDEGGKIVGVDADNLLAYTGGKIKQIEALELPGEVYVIGDGYNDYEIKKAGLAHEFFAFTENVVRDSVVSEADHIAPSFDEFLYKKKLPMSISYPKNRIKVLLLENIHANAQKVMLEEGYQVELLPGSLNEAELCERIKDVSILGIRSKTQVTAKVLESAERLMAVGAFCIGTNQIDLAGCLKKGVPVFNAPFSNTRSVVELAIAELILLMRGIPERNRKMHTGVWDKSATGSHEVRGKKLGIVGYGNIGVQLSVIAENLGMDVYYYDVVEKLALSNATKCSSLEELLRTVDAVTLHVDGREDNTSFFGREQFEMMKDGAVFLNLARGFVVDVEALADNVRSGKIKGAAVDVFPKEPKTNQEPFESALAGLPNVILSPHVGGSTQEAQVHISNYVPTKIINYVNTGSTDGSVNFPNLQLAPVVKAHRLIHIHHNKPGVLAEMNRIFGDFGINIVGQYLKTNETIGYVISDVDRGYDEGVTKSLKKIDGTIRFRVLY